VTLAGAAAPELMNHAGALHAGVQSALIDTACGFAAGTVAGNVVTLQMNVQFLASAKGERFEARARVTKAGRSQIFAEAQLFALARAGRAGEEGAGGERDGGAGEAGVTDFVDFTAPQIAASGITAEKIRAGLEGDGVTLRGLGYQADILWVDDGDTAEQVLRDRLGEARYDAVMIGAGLRTLPPYALLFERWSTRCTRPRRARSSRSTATRRTRRRRSSAWCERGALLIPMPARSMPGCRRPCSTRPAAMRRGRWRAMSSRCSSTSSS
jgi:uncharacterized protein (TIGR00369 family)